MSGSQGIIEIDTEAELQAIIQKLNSLPNQITAPNILKNAINATARKVKNQVTKDAKARYAVKDKTIFKKENQGAPKVRTASPATMTATISSKGPMQDIMAFMTRPNAGTAAAAARVLDSGTMKPLEMGGLKAFVTRFASGHMAIVQRRGGPSLPVKKLLSPAVPMMLGNEEIRDKAEMLTYEILQAEIGKRIEKVLAGA